MSRIAEIRKSVTESTPVLAGTLSIGAPTGAPTGASIGAPTGAPGEASSGVVSARAFSDLKCAHSSSRTFFWRAVSPSSVSIATSTVPRGPSSRIPART